MKRIRRVLVLAVAPLLGGCGTIDNLASGDVKIYGGTRGDVGMIEGDATPYFDFRPIAAVDLPFSLVLDTALLPATIPLSAVTP